MAGLLPENSSNMGTHGCLLQCLIECVCIVSSSQTPIEAGALYHKLPGRHCFPTKFNRLPEHPQDPKHGTGGCSVFYFIGQVETEI